jgi:hypothetical protein
MSEPDVEAVINAAKAADAAETVKVGNVAQPAADKPAVDDDPRIADLIGKGLTEAEARQLIAVMW